MSLLVGDAVPAEAVPSAFSYTFQGTLVSGNLSLLTLGLRGEEVPGTPIP